jgi:hypothetical protein
MSKPITYYLSEQPPFGLEKIERLPCTEKVVLAQRLLEMAPFQGITDQQSMTIRRAAVTTIGCNFEELDGMGWMSKVRLANAILQSACDDMAVDDLVF